MFVYAIHAQLSCVLPLAGGIPTRYAYYSEEFSPPLAWSNPPEGTMSFALMADNPDAPDPHAHSAIYLRRPASYSKK